VPPIPVLSPAQSADWDRQADAAGVPLATLMDAAGRAAAHVIAARFPDRLRGGVLVATGPGNNGGDGWVIARALHRAGVPVFVSPLPPGASPLAARVAAQARSEGVRVVEVDGPWPQIELVVDALLGTGASGPLRPAVAALVERVRELEVPVVAVDGPTGVDLGTGAAHGATVHAVLSITFGGLRRGHLLARDEAGDVVVVDIGHPPIGEAVPALVTDLLASAWLPRFRADDHKGRRGRVVVIGGDAGMTGAIRLAARAAFGAGAGLVHAVAPPETVSALVQAEPDLQTLAQSFDRPPSTRLLALIGSADAVVIGPGLGRGEGRAEFVATLVAGGARVVLDADGLNAFQEAGTRLAGLGAGRELVLTPHPGEFRRIFPQHADGLEHDPWTAAEAAAEESGVTVVLKGVPTVITRRGTRTWTVGAGNPGLATGGSGDVLSGIVGALLAQGLDGPVAAACGAQALGRAGDLAARRVTARGMRPMDVIAALSDVWRGWETLQRVPPPPAPPVLFELEGPQQW
jgi:ADP-dependent NAD(P)H-hydrate dehydratase / NAD(P)H-hydrate epimerase